MPDQKGGRRRRGRDVGSISMSSSTGQSMTPNAVEEGLEQHLDFDKVSRIGRAGHRVVPVVLQDADSGDVLFVGYANEDAFRLTLKNRRAVLYSTSRNQIWHKGATSGDTLELVEVRVNCEQNSLLYLVRKAGAGVCHTQNSDGVPRQTCFYRSVGDSDTLDFV